jgi:5'-phosphate synthase pdxT subunit
MEAVGLLALQGDFDRHRQALAALGRPTRLVRRPAELADCSHLVIPGGESTTLVRLVDRARLREPLRDFAARRPVLGTCAGLILLARSLVDEDRRRHGVAPLGLLDVAVLRNGYGRQIDSFTEDLAVDALNGTRERFRAVYIRAPRITAVGEGVEVLARRDAGGEPVAVRQGHLMGLTFHPELTDDRRFHAAFLALGETS